MDASSLPRVAVIIPTYNRRESVLETLEALLGDDYPEKTIILVDDGSVDGTSDFCRRRFPQVELVRGDGNLWWSGAINLGLEVARRGRFELVAWFNDDNRVESGTLKIMVAAARQLAGQCAVQGEARTIVAARTRSTLTGADEWIGEPPRWHSDYGHWQPQTMDRETVPLDNPPGGRGVLIPMACFEEIGGIDQRHFPHYWADHDFHYRAMKAGYRYYLATGAVVWNRPNRPTSDEADRFSLRWILHFLFSRRSPMNLPTLRRLLKRHLARDEYRARWSLLLRQTAGWLASGWMVRHPRLHRLARIARRIFRS